jgi:Lysine-specific metallo-endopeptidase
MTTKDCAGGNVTAHTWTTYGLIWTTHYVNFCPLFFNDARMTSLATKVEEATNNITKQITMDEWRPVRARTMFHEMFHWNPTVTVPMARDYAYKPSAVTSLAANNEPTATMNAESYAQAALGMYVKHKFDLLQPPLPRQGQTVDDLTDDLAEGAADDPPDGWVSPVSEDSPTFNPAGTLLLSEIISNPVLAAFITERQSQKTLVE